MAQPEDYKPKYPTAIFQISFEGTAVEFFNDGKYTKNYKLNMHVTAKFGVICTPAKFHCGHPHYSTLVGHCDTKYTIINKLTELMATVLVL